MTIKTIHGKFVFPNQRFIARTSPKDFTWCEYTAQCRHGVESDRLRSRCCYYANRMSYHEVATLLQDETGIGLLSAQRIHEIVEEEATRLSVIKATEARAVFAPGTVLPPINQHVAIYDAHVEEVLLFDDGIQVKKQKAHRKKPLGTESSQSPPQKGEKGSQEKGSQEKGIQEKGSQKKGSQEKGSQEKGSQEKGSQEKGSQEKMSQEKGSQEKMSQEKMSQEKGSQEKGSKKKVNTDVFMLQRSRGGFLYMMEGLDGTEAEGDHMSAEEFVKSTLVKEYGDRKEALNLVAITDGARTIRLFFERVFGCVIVLILDWYHLEKKVWELMSMIAWNTAEKEIHCRALLACLWSGKVDDALDYLHNSVSPRHQKKYDELLTYLTKHHTEIINYQARQEAGKSIGSGRMEKGVDQVIGRRQKDNGMSWSDVGSKALGLLKIHELNEQIEDPGLLFAA